MLMLYSEVLSRFVVVGVERRNDGPCTILLA